MKKKGEWKYSSTILDLSTRWWRWVASFKLQPLYPQEISPGTHWIGGWVGPTASLKDVERKYDCRFKITFRPISINLVWIYRCWFVFHRHRVTISDGVPYIFRGFVAFLSFSRRIQEQYLQTVHNCFLSKPYLSSLKIIFPSHCPHTSSTAETLSFNSPSLDCVYATNVALLPAHVM
jgi:hypothetical protein